MSRLIIKNLPKNITEEKVREIFSEKGTVTDVQLKFTNDGKFRQFAFVGYQNDEDASAAVDSLNKTFINTSRITVERCATLGDKSKPKAWSKYAPDSSAYKKQHKINDKQSEEKQPAAEEIIKEDETVKLLEKYKSDPLFEEFLQVHDKKGELEKKLHKLTENETKVLEDHNEDSAIEDDSSSAESEEGDEEKLANKEISDAEYMKSLMGKSGETSERKPRQKMEKKVKEKVNLFTLKLRDLPYSCKKKDIKAFFKPNTPYSIRLPRKIHGIAYVGFKNEKNMKKGLLKDRSFIAGKRISVTKYVHAEECNQDVSDPRKNKWKNQEETLKNEEDIAESGRIFVRNLAYTTTEEDIEQLFSKYGPLTEINLPIDSTTRKMKGFGVITFLMPEHAVKAYTELDGSVLHGRMLHLLPGKSKDANDDSAIEESSNYKLKKATKQKSLAGSSHNWNSLFLGHDAVAEVIADTYNTSKEAVIGPESKGSAAVRLALGETQIIAQTRKYLEQEGVILDAFSDGGCKRSKTIILIKNLPNKTEAKELRELFSKHGEIGRLILPPSGISAIVEFLEPSEARKAFTNLAYSKFKNAPLYLEWAPENSLSNKTKVNDKNVEPEENDKTTAENELSKVDENEEEDEPEDDTTLFVKNLNFKTTDEDLKKHFEGCGKIFYANVATKKDKTDPDKKLSMGYGFVRFYTKTGADKALKTLQQSVLDGKSLELKRSERTLPNEVTASRKISKKAKQTGTKLLVRNIPFQANRKELLELFKTFGEIKALRLPKKMSGESHRGFGFVDFVTESDAKAAFEAISQSTHLYGRRLVLEWASSEEGVDEIRKRTAEHFVEKEVKKSKKSVLNIE